MNRLISLHNSFFNSLTRGSDILLPTLARITFASIFLIYYWNSAGLKIDGSIFTPSAGAFAQIFPKAAEEALYDITQLTVFQKLVIFSGTVAEYALPALLIVGLLTRLAALGTFGFIIIQTAVDVNGHNVPLGALFNPSIDLIDERTLWIFLMLVLIFKGAGPLSIDRILKLA